MKSWLCSAAVLAILPLTGCNLYFGGDDEPPPCYDYPAGAPLELRDPQTGTCQYIGGGGGGGCYGDPVPAYDVAMPDWGQCWSQCEGLDENSCLGASGCYAAYSGFLCPPNADCLWSGISFQGCWQTAPSGPVQGGGCTGLDAYACSRHDDCSAVYSPGPADGTEGQQFAQCIDENPTQLGCYSDTDCGPGYTCTASTECLPPPGCDPATGQACPPVCYGKCEPIQPSCGGIDCGYGYHCEEQCYPCDPTDPNGTCMSQCDAVCVPDQVYGCEVVDCAPGYHCEELCTGACEPNGGACPPTTCQATCLPDQPIDPGNCDEQVICAVAPPACPIGTVPGVINGCYSGFCIPTNECAHDPGTCDGFVACDALPPSCPIGTVPGVRNGCWSGYCIPDSLCPQTVVTCESITDEMTCASRSDCTGVYEGINCVCDPNGTCTCEAQKFARCESRGPTPTP